MPSLSVQITNGCESIFNLGDGSATATPSDGSSPYTYLWDTGETTQTVTDLKSGYHYVTVTDSAGAQIVGFTAICPCEEEYDFNMTDSQLECFLQVASCKYGDKAHEYFDKTSKGFRDCCSEKDLFMLMKNIETTDCWHPQSIVSVEQPSYWVVNFLQYTQESNSNVTIFILSQQINYTFVTAKTLDQNIDALVAAINASSTFKAQRDGDRLFIYAPSGYSGVGVALFISIASSSVLTCSILTTNGFQGGELPCGSYVDWQGNYHEAPEDCLDQSQIGNIIDNIKKFADCECTALADIFKDDID